MCHYGSISFRLSLTMHCFDNCAVLEKKVKSTRKFVWRDSLNYMSFLYPCMTVHMKTICLMSILHFKRSFPINFWSVRDTCCDLVTFKN